MPCIGCISHVSWMLKSSAFLDNYKLQIVVNKARSLVITYNTPNVYTCKYSLSTSVVWWSEFLATDPEIWVRFPALPNFLRSSGSGAGSTQPRNHN
jgi:hypothetical protein